MARTTAGCRRVTWSRLSCSQPVGAEAAADGVADSVFIAGPEVAVNVEGDLGGLVAERRLHLLHAAAGVDQRAGEEVAEVVERDRLGQRSSPPGGSHLVAELGGVEGHTVAVEQHAAGTEAVLLNVGSEMIEHPH